MGKTTKRRTNNGVVSDTVSILMKISNLWELGPIRLMRMPKKSAWVDFSVTKRIWQITYPTRRGDLSPPSVFHLHLKRKRGKEEGNTVSALSSLPPPLFFSIASSILLGPCCGIFVHVSEGSERENEDATSSFSSYSSPPPPPQPRAALTINDHLSNSSPLSHKSGEEKNRKSFLMGERKCPPRRQRRRSR